MEISLDLGKVKVLKAPTDYVMVHFSETARLDISARDGRIVLALDGANIRPINDKGNLYIIEMAASK